MSIAVNKTIQFGHHGQRAMDQAQQGATQYLLLKVSMKGHSKQISSKIAKS